MKKEKIVFSSEKEKNSYIRFVNETYEKDGTKIFSGTGKDIKKMIKNFQDNGMPGSMFYTFFGIAIILMISVFLGFSPTPIRVLLITSIYELAEAFSDNYLGILPTLFSTPFLFIKNIVNGIRDKVNHVININTIKKGVVVYENDENGKNSKEEKTSILIDKVTSDYVPGCDFYKVVELLKNLNKKIPNIKNEEERARFLDRLYKITSLLIRCNKLSQERRSEAMRFAYDEISRMNIGINDELEIEMNNKNGLYKLMTEVNGCDENVSEEVIPQKSISMKG